MLRIDCCINNDTGQQPFIKYFNSVVVVKSNHPVKQLLYIVTNIHHKNAV